MSEEVLRIAAAGVAVAADDDDDDALCIGSEPLGGQLVLLRGDCVCTYRFLLISKVACDTGGK